MKCKLAISWSTLEPDFCDQASSQVSVALRQTGDIDSQELWMSCQAHILLPKSFHESLHTTFGRNPVSSPIASNVLVLAVGVAKVMRTSSFCLALSLPA